MKTKATLFGMGMALLLGLTTATSAAPQYQVPTPPPAHPAVALPPGAQSVVSATVGKDNDTYHARAGSRGLTVENLQQRLRADFTEAGVQITSGDATWALRYEGADYGTPGARAASVTPIAEANRVEYRRGSVTEWYVNGPLGLEQGFTLTSPPGRPTGAPLLVRLSVAGDLEPHTNADGRGLTLAKRDGESVLAYRGLAAWDATGRALPATLHVDRSALVLRIDDRTATYPVTIDPLVQQAKYVTTDGSIYVGRSVAASSDALVVGAYFTNAAGSYQGAAYVFVKPAGGWGGVAQIAKLTASDGYVASGPGGQPFTDQSFGISVAISGDTVVVGANQALPEHPSFPGYQQGAAYVFVKPGSGWTDMTETAKLTGATTQGDFGNSVAIDGDTVVVGSSGPGGVGGSGGGGFLFEKPGGGWTNMTQTAYLTATDASNADVSLNNADGLGYGVAIRGDVVVVGATLAFVGPGRTGAQVGAAYVFLKPAGGWAGTRLQRAKLTPPGGTTHRLGISLGIDNNTIVIGAPFPAQTAVGNTPVEGVAYVYLEPSAGWATALPATLTPTTTLMASDGATGDYFASSVAIQTDRIVAGNPSTNTGAYVFDKPPSGWPSTMTETQKLTFLDQVNVFPFGLAVALSDPNVFVGAPGGQSGGAYVFATGTVPPDHTLTVYKTGNGAGSVTSFPAGINCGRSCSVDSASFSPVQSVFLDATAAVGSYFAGWFDDCSPSGVVRMDVDKKCTARFERIVHTLTVVTVGSGTVTSTPTGIDCGITCSAPFFEGDIITLTPSTSVLWGGDCAGSGVVTVTMDGDKTCFATFGTSASADLSIAATPSSLVTVGVPFTYAVTVHNFGPDPSTGGSWTMTLTPGLTISQVSPSSGCSINSGSNAVICVVGVMASGANDFYVVTATATTATTGTTLDTTFTVSGNEDSNPANNSTPTHVPVFKAATSTSTPTASPNPSVFGQPVTFSATVSGGFPPLTSNVAFYEGATFLGPGGVNSAGVWTLAYSGLAVGSHDITAAYPGDTNNLASPKSQPVTVIVRAQSTIVLTSSQPNPSLAGQPVTITATVTGAAPSGGFVTFYKNSSGTAVQVARVQVAPAPPTTATAATTLTGLAVGVYTLTAHYEGDTFNTPSDTSPPQLTQVVNTNKTSGTATKAIVPSALDLQGAFGIGTSADKQIGSNQTDFSHAHANADLPMPLPRVGASGLTGSVGRAGARAIAYETISVGASPCGCYQANADLSGFFGNLGGGQVIAAMYVFDPTEFLNTIDNSGLTLKEFLLGGDTLNAYAVGDESTLSLGRSTLFPAGLRQKVFQPFRWSPSFTGQHLMTPPVPAAAGDTFIVVFDIIVYAPGGSYVVFNETLKPSPVFLTDLSGNAVPFTPLGPWSPTPPPAANLTLTPAATTSALTTPVTVTATATTATGAPVPDTNVFFDIIGGPGAQPLGPFTSDANGQVTFTYAGGTALGTDQIQAHIGTLQSNIAQITWTAGPLDHITISPASATITVGGSQSYTAQALDAFNNSIGDVTASTAFGISPDGSCTGATCTATAAGLHTVTGTYGALTATATLNVNNVSTTFTFEGFFAPIDMSTGSLVVWNTVKAGQAVPVKWLLTLNGTPVSDPASFAGLSSYPIACSSATGSIDDAIDQTATGASGLQYNGGGNWQYNWQTLSSYKNTCRAVVVKFSDGTTSAAANFKFK